MSAAAQTRIFGIKVGIDPKILAGVLGVIVALVFWYNMRSSDDDAPATTAARPEVAAAPGSVVPHRKARERRTVMATDRNALRIRPVDATDGRIDPTLRTDLIARLQSVQPLAPGRSLFEVASAQTLAMGMQPPIKKTIVPVNAAAPVPVVMDAAPQAPVVNIPLKYYGFVHPASNHDSNRGLFMDGDNILVAKEGDQLDGKYLVVELNANSAKMEDTQLRQGQTLPVAPEAMAQ